MNLPKLNIKEKNKELNKESNTDKEQKTKDYGVTMAHFRRSLISGAIVGAIVVLIAVVSTAMPYAITIDGDAICYVRNKEKAGKVTQKIIQDYLPEGTTLQAVEMEGDFTVDSVSLSKVFTVDCVSVDEATKIVKSKLENPDEFGATEEGKSVKAVSGANKAVDDLVLKAEASDGSEAEVKPVTEEKVEPADAKAEDKASEDANKEEVKSEEKTEDADEETVDKTDHVGEDPAIALLSTAMVTEEYDAEVEYIKDDTMLAGDSEVVSEGKKGVHDVLRQYRTVNGEIVETTDLQTETVKEAEPKVVKKGTLGLPDGEDWKTFEGDPIFNDGEALTKTALNYLGAPYKYGGYSLTTGIDCVQFIRQMYAKYGIKLPNGKNALKHVGTAVSFANAQPGDIICYSNHYALYLGDNKIVHATSKGGVKVRNNAQFRKIVTVRRIPRN